MTDQPRSTDPDRARWARYLAGLPGRDAGGAAACPPAMDLAAWADGRAEPALRDGIDAHLAGCAACREAVEDLRALEARRGEAVPLVPARVLAAASGLAGAPADAAAPRRRWLGLGAAAAASVAVSFVAWRIGAGVRAAEAMSEHRLVAEMSFGALDGADADTFELLGEVPR